MEIKMQWTGGLRFETTNGWGQTVATDASRDVGGGESGFKPTELLLYGVAGCTGIDILRILEKKRQKIDSLEIRVEGEQNDEYPKPFHTLRVHYIATGQDLSEAALEQAIRLSEEKYCVVSQTIQQPATVTTSFEIATA